MREDSQTYHDDTAGYREYGEPNSGVQLFEEHVTWDLRDTLNTP